MLTRTDKSNCVLRLTSAEGHELHSQASPSTTLLPENDRSHCALPLHAYASSASPEISLASHPLSVLQFRECIACPHSFLGWHECNLLEFALLAIFPWPNDKGTLERLIKKEPWCLISTLVLLTDSVKTVVVKRSFRLSVPLFSCKRLVFHALPAWRLMPVMRATMPECFYMRPTHGHVISILRKSTYHLCTSPMAAQRVLLFDIPTLCDALMPRMLSLSCSKICSLWSKLLL